MDNLCVMCNKNVPVIYTTRFENGSIINDGICLSCALRNKVGGIDQMLEKSGITEDNVDEITEQMNEVLNQIQENGGSENILSAMFGGQIPDNIQDILGPMAGVTAGEDPSDTDYDEEQSDDEEDADNDDSNDKNKGTSADNDEDNKPQWPFLFPGKNQSSDDNKQNQRRSRRNVRNKRKNLDQYATNLNKKAKDGKIDPLIGREKELNRVIEILNRRNKNNPVLLGEPGVGKTAIAEGLATRIVEGNVPPKLQDMELYQLDMTAVVAGTQFRGQFENRMKGIVEEASSAGNIVLVIDELHNIIGAGDADGAMNAANILKPALAKGEIRVLGSTTLEEYRRHIEKDSALERRFQKVIVDPPTEKETMEIMMGLRDTYQNHHHVVYSDDVLRACIKLSERYITERFLPDKAIDLMDEAGSKANLKDEDLIIQGKLKNEISQLDRELQNLSEKMPDDPESEEAENLYAKQAEFRSSKMKAEEELAEVEERLKPSIITEENIAQIVAEWTGIPVTSISYDEKEKLLNLESLLHKRIIGQESAVNAVSRALRRSRAGLRAKRKPSSFIFVGPTGVGKTELAKAVTEVMFDSEDNLIRLDMSEYMEAHTVSKLIGSPPGYVGYDDGGQLTEKVRRKPYSVLLFDEIEKAHSDIFNIMLQILDEGRLTDAQGKLVDFSNTIVIMTSNVGTSQKSGYGFGAHADEAEENRIRAALRDAFRPEFLNRVDEVVVFHRLKKAEIREIVDLMLVDVEDNLKASASCALEVSEAAKDYLGEAGYSDEYGARQLQREITKSIEDPLAEMKLRGELDNKNKVKVDVKSDKLKFKAE